MVRQCHDRSDARRGAQALASRGAGAGRQRRTVGDDGARGGGDLKLRGQSAVQWMKQWRSSVGSGGRCARGRATHLFRSVLDDSGERRVLRHRQPGSAGPRVSSAHILRLCSAGGRHAHFVRQFGVRGQRDLEVDLPGALRRPAAIGIRQTMRQLTCGACSQARGRVAAHMVDWWQERSGSLMHSHSPTWSPRPEW